MVIFLNVVFGMGGIGGFTVASWYGPVAVVMPIVTASKLLSNMVTQIAFGLSQYDKSMRVGTYILCCAAACLPQTGPAEPKSVDAAEMLNTLQAQAWLVVLVLSLVGCIVDYHFFKDIKGRTLFTLSANVAISTALGANLAKYLGSAASDQVPIIFVLGSILAFLSFAYTYLAALDCDLSVYIPMSESVQLIINAITGMVIWGDLQRMPSLLTYTMVYALIILGVYELSSHDLFGFTFLIRGNRVSKQAVLAYAKTIAETQSAPKMREDISATHLLEALSNLIKDSVCKGELTKTELMDMIQRYHELKKVEVPAKLFKESGEARETRRQKTSRKIADRFLQNRTRTALLPGTEEAQLQKPFLESTSPHEP